MSIHPNAYYNYKKNRKDGYRKELASKLEKVGRKFHDLDGKAGGGFRSRAEENLAGRNKEGCNKTEGCLC